MDKIYYEQKVITSCKVYLNYQKKPNIGKELMEMSGNMAERTERLKAISEKRNGKQGHKT